MEIDIVNWRNLVDQAEELIETVEGIEEQGTIERIETWEAMQPKAIRLANVVILINTRRGNVDS